MLFSGLPFLYYFLPAVLVCYFAAPRKLKNAVLFVFSLIFYGWGEPRYIVLMIVSIVSGFVFAASVFVVAIPIAVLTSNKNLMNGGHV